jgi:hypothetical protein
LKAYREKHKVKLEVRRPGLPRPNFALVPPFGSIQRSNTAISYYSTDDGEQVLEWDVQPPEPRHSNKFMPYYAHQRTTMDKTLLECGILLYRKLEAFTVYLNDQTLMGEGGVKSSVNKKLL